MKKHITLALFFTFMIFLLTTCKTDVNSIIDDYNSHFNPDSSVNPVTGPCPGDDDFTADIMLEEEYLVWSDATINLSAPNNCSTFSWVITDPDDKEETPIPVHYFGHKPEVSYSEWNQQRLFINIIDSGLKINKVYKLSLTVVGADGHTYKDVAALVVYQHLSF